MIGATKDMREERDEGTEGTKIVILACETIMYEIVSVARAASRQVRTVFLPHDLHRSPWRLRDRLQEQVDRAADEGADAIVLGYGLCSGGVVGVRAPRCPLVIPQAHDCITLLLGSAEAYEREFRKAPGTYYLSRGWIEHGDDPLTLYQGLVARYDEAVARWLATEPLKGYTRVAYIDTRATRAGEAADREYRAHAREVAAFIGAQYDEIVGSLDLLERLVECGSMVGRAAGTHVPRVDGIAVIQPGQELDVDKVLPPAPCVVGPGPEPHAAVEAWKARDGASGD